MSERVTSIPIRVALRSPASLTNTSAPITTASECPLPATVRTTVATNPTNPTPALTKGAAKTNSNAKEAGAFPTRTSVTASRIVPTAATKIPAIAPPLLPRFVLNRRVTRCCYNTMSYLVYEGSVRTSV